MDREESRLKRSAFVMREKSLSDYLVELCCSLAGDHCKDMRVYPVLNPLFNASMAPNGMMQVWSGLLLRVENEAQLASVLGHEIGHYLERHSLERIKDAKSKAGAATLFSFLGLPGAFVALGILGSAMSFSREQETQADLIGLQLMQRAGYQGSEAAKLWENMLAEQAVNPEAKRAPAGFFASHPLADDRIATLAAATQNSTGQSHTARFREITAPFRAQWLESELSRNQFDQSLVVIERLLSAEPQDPILLHYRAEAWRKRSTESDTSQAFEEFMRLSVLPNAYALSHRSLGLLALKLRNPEIARQGFQRYVAANPQANDRLLIESYIKELSQ